MLVLKESDFEGFLNFHKKFSEKKLIASKMDPFEKKFKEIMIFENNEDYIVRSKF
jgi:Holliday junction resolvase